MGDRTYVTLSILTAQVKAAEQIITNDYDEKQTYGDNGILTYYTYSQVNYGELDFLDALEVAGIAYTSEWGPGSEFGAGAKTCRFTKDGAVFVKEIYDTELNPDMGGLLERIDNYQQLKDYILQHKERTSVLPWDNQIEYGKLYRTHQLIAT